MRKVIQTYKNLGETPLEALDRLRGDVPELAREKMTYLGRLDPMAEGLLLVLVGDTRGKEEYLGLDKEYEFEVLWGFETDTYDILGLVTSADTDSLALYPQAGSDATREPVSAFATDIISNLLEKIKNIKKQTYPPYSSKKIQGKQLWEWAREGEDTLGPERDVEVYSLNHFGDREVVSSELLDQIVNKVSLVKGDFRQGEILDKWREVLAGREEKFLISKFRAHVSSGTYIRGLVYEMGKILGLPAGRQGCGALALSIKRTRVGEYRV